MDSLNPSGVLGVALQRRTHVRAIQEKMPADKLEKPYRILLERSKTGTNGQEGKQPQARWAEDVLRQLEGTGTDRQHF